jgi:hypothetical protein
VPLLSRFRLGRTTTVVYIVVPFREPRGDAFRGNIHSEGQTTSLKGKPNMGDRSPKSVQKQASQKQSRTDDANSKKQQLINAQQATKAKLAANKKK